MSPLICCCFPGAIGPCEGLDHLIRILDHTTRRPVRHQLLLLLLALLQPRSMQQSQQVRTTGHILQVLQNSSS